jgi:photosystem II stability/assembly factor-like uncharacterized protein
MPRLPRFALCAAAASALLPMASRAQRIDTIPSPTTALLQAVAVPSDSVVWLSGHRGTVLRSTDGGWTFTVRPVPGAEQLQFRDIHARDAATAWILSAGNGDQSRIYRTDDGGATWARQFTNPDSAAFYDCLTFFDDRIGVAYSDAVNGRTLILRTTDGGGSWAHLPAGAVPPPLEGEGAFAASGGCVTSVDDRHGWVALGGPGARLFRTTDAGATWSLHETPFVRGAGGGMTAVAFRDALVGVGVAGRIDQMNADTASAAVGFTRDGGRTWQLAARPPRPGAPFGVTWATDGGIIVVGPGGLFLGTEGGTRWRTLDERAWWSVGGNGRTVWAVGPQGRIIRLGF